MGSRQRCLECASIPFMSSFSFICSTLFNRGGMFAPILGGLLLMMNQSIPVYTSAVVFVVAGLCVSLLKERDGELADRRKVGLR